MPARRTGTYISTECIYRTFHRLIISAMKDGKR